MYEAILGLVGGRLGGNWPEEKLFQDIWASNL